MAHTVCKPDGSAGDKLGLEVADDGVQDVGTDHAYTPHAL